MNEYPNIVKAKLSAFINEMSSYLWLFVKNPDKDFTRNRKLPFEKVMRLLISMGGNSIYKELLESQGYDVNTATSSAFVQQRDKILPFAFEFLLHRFTKSHTDLKTYRGYRLLAADSSSLQIATDPGDSDTYFQNLADSRGMNRLPEASYEVSRYWVTKTPQGAGNESGWRDALIAGARSARVRRHAGSTFCI